MSKVLHVDDDVETLKLYESAFSREKIEYRTAQDGEEGLKKAISESPSLVILDLKLPKMDGFQLLLRLKSDPKTKSIPVIVLTNLGEKKDVDSCIYIGALKYFIKGQVSPDMVVQEVKNVIGMISIF